MNNMHKLVQNDPRMRMVMDGGGGGGTTLFFLSNHNPGTY